jgi:hypothetical protein
VDRISQLGATPKLPHLPLNSVMPGSSRYGDARRTPEPVTDDDHG